MADKEQTNSLEISFPGASGEMLAARLDLPQGQVRAYAVFAHCFTCSKDIYAAARISKGMSENGLAVLRFDFSGLGASEGDFANTNFSSNVDDLKAAIDFLTENYETPQILVGHSLGGAAVLAAASDMPELKAVATIGAPADVEHVSHNFKSSLDEIEQKGIAEVSLGGRPFTIKKQFLDDIRRQNLQQRLEKIKAALLVFHAPRDEIVGIENAAEIFANAKHPKSYISLDDADHLVRRASDAFYIADVISAWSLRYLKPAEKPKQWNEDEQTIIVQESGVGKFQQNISLGSHHLVADEPVSVGGLNTGPAPVDFLGIALGACTSMTLRMYAERKGWEFGRIRVDVIHTKIEDSEGGGDKKDQFTRNLSVEGNISQEQRDKLVEIANKCPVHKIMSKPSEIVTHIGDAQT